MTSVAQPKDRTESTKVPVPPPIQAIVDAKDRTGADRQLDASRHPGELLAFLGLRPGMRVAELSAGGGYTTELAGPATAFFLILTVLLTGFAVVLIVGHIVWGQKF